jgi:hypothetical protein
VERFMNENVITEARPKSAPPRLFDLVRDAIRRLTTVEGRKQLYLHWIKRYILHSIKRHPRELGPPR